MKPEISRALAVVKNTMQLGPTAVGELIADYGNVLSLADLPEWIRVLQVGSKRVAAARSFATSEDETDEPWAVILAYADLDDGDTTRAAGQDVTPGHDELHHYWTRGPGLARWAESPTPWRTLLANLVEEVKGVPLSVLKRWTSRWFIEVFGYSAGSDKNRVAHGHPPRGKKIGPG